MSAAFPVVILCPTVGECLKTKQTMKTSPKAAESRGPGCGTVPAARCHSARARNLGFVLLGCACTAPVLSLAQVTSRLALVE